MSNDTTTLADGWVATVEVPTEAMLAAGRDAPGVPRLNFGQLAMIYIAMVEARQVPPVPAQLSGNSVELERDAERYRVVRRGQHWSVINGLGEELRAEALDAAADRAIAVAGNVREVDAEPMYYLQDSRGYVGNCPSWWKLGGGYTTRLDEAQRYTLESAMKQHDCRDTDVPWPCATIDSLQRPTVDMQYMGNVKKHAASMRAAIATSKGANHG